MGEGPRYGMAFWGAPTVTFKAECEEMLGIPVKPASGIASWPEWPDDVRELLEVWNRGLRDRPMKLSFYRRGLFDCVDCKARCEPSGNGAAYLNEQWLCDDCLIARARRAIERKWDRLDAPWRGVGTMRRRS